MTSEEAIAQLRGLLTESDAAMKRGELKAANLIAEDAKAAAPGSLPSKIYVTQDEDVTTVIGGDDLSAWVEFGTGTENVKLNFAVFGNDMEMIKEAEKFIQTRLGHGLAHPFFWPAIFRHREDIMLAIEEELSKLAK